MELTPRNHLFTLFTRLTLFRHSVYIDSTAQTAITV